MTPQNFHGGPITITAYDWVPGSVQGLVRDLRLRWALEEATFPYRIELVRMGTQAEAENLARQPFGQIPTLTVGGATIFESGACLWRIAEASPALLPDAGPERDQCFAWLFAALNTVEPPLSTMAMLQFYEWEPEQFGITDTSAVGTLRPAARADAVMRLKQVAERLGGREHLVAGRFTVADLIMTDVLRLAQWMDLLEETPSLSAYLDRHTARPAFKKALADQFATHRKNAAKYEAAA